MAGESLYEVDGFLKAAVSIGLLVFSVIVVMALIFEQQTILSADVHPALAFACLWLALLWLAFVEGGQASLVGLPPIDRQLYYYSHPISHRICSYAHKGDNLDRYLVGRQFMVLVLVFAINMAGAYNIDAGGDNDNSGNVLNLPRVLSLVFVQSGLCLILITCILGQLNTQINASHCMLDLINDWASWFTVQTAMIIEVSGLLHVSYLIQWAVGKLAGKTIASNEPRPRSLMQAIWFWGRVLFSAAVLTASVAVTTVAILEGKTAMWTKVPPFVSFTLFVVLSGIVGLLEGMQIAYFAVSRMTEEKRNINIWAQSTCELLFGCEGLNLPGFIVGRQLVVVSCFFVMARATSLHIPEGEDNVLGVSDDMQDFLNTGLLGALVTTIFSSIAWQLVASAFPLWFLSNPISYALLRLCLVVESTGICAAAFLIADLLRVIFRFHRDEVYVGTAEERADMQQHAADLQLTPDSSSQEGDDDCQPDGGKLQPPEGVGHLMGGVLLFPPRIADRNNRITPQERRGQILSLIELLRRQVELASTDEEKELHKAALLNQLAALRHVDREIRARRTRSSSSLRLCSSGEYTESTAGLAVIEENDSSRFEDDGDEEKV